MPASRKPGMGCRRGGRWGCWTLFFAKQATKTKQAAHHSPPPRPHEPSPSRSMDGEGLGTCPRPESRIWRPPSKWPVGPQHAVDEESTRQPPTPMEDGHEMPFFSTVGVESVLPSGGEVWGWVTAAAAAAEVAAVMVPLQAVDEESTRQRGRQWRMAMKCHFS